MPSPSTSSPHAAGAARQREHVADGVMGRELVRPHRTGEHHVLADLLLGGEPAQPAAGRAVPDQQQPGSGHPCPHGRESADERVLTLPGDQPGQACDHRGVAEAVPPAQLGPCRRVGPEPLGVDAGRQELEGGAGAEGGSHPSAGVARDHGERVGVAADAAQHLPRARKHRPAHLVAVRAGHDTLDAGAPPEVGREQGERRRRAEPHRGRAVLAGHRGGPQGDRAPGQHQRRRVPVDRVGAGGVERPVAGPCRRVDGELTGRKQVGEGVQVALDAAVPGREVVGDQQRARHRTTLSTAGVRSGGGRWCSGRPPPVPGERTRSGATGAGRR